MQINDRINQLRKDFRLSKNTDTENRLNVLKLVKNDLEAHVKNGVAEDEALLKSIKSQEKKLLDEEKYNMSLGREDALERIKSQKEELYTFKPKLMSEDEIRHYLENLDLSNNIGQIMKTVKENIGNKVDMGQVSKILKELQK